MSAGTSVSGALAQAAAVRERPSPAASEAEDSKRWGSAWQREMERLQAAAWFQGALPGAAAGTLPAQADGRATGGRLLQDRPGARHAEPSDSRRSVPASEVQADTMAPKTNEPPGARPLLGEGLSSEAPTPVRERQPVVEQAVPTDQAMPPRPGADMAPAAAAVDLPGDRAVPLNERAIDTPQGPLPVERAHGGEGAASGDLAARWQAMDASPASTALPAETPPPQAGTRTAGVSDRVDIVSPLHGVGALAMPASAQGAEAGGAAQAPSGAIGPATPATRVEPAAAATRPPAPNAGQPAARIVPAAVQPPASGVGLAAPAPTAGAMALAEEGGAAPSPAAAGPRALASIERMLGSALGGQPGPRLHLSWDGRAVTVWVGVDGTTDAALLLRTVQQVLSQQGLQLSALVCNGRTIVQARPGMGQEPDPAPNDTPAAANGHRPHPSRVSALGSEASSTQAEN